MSKTTLIRVGDVARAGELPPAARVVLDFGGEPYAADRVQAWRDAGLTVTALLVPIPSLRDRLLLGFADQGEPTVVQAAERPTVEDALAVVPMLKRSHFVTELALDDEADLDVLKVLSSLGVKTRVRFSSLASASEPVLDAMQDAVLRPGRRAPVTPFAELQGSFLEEGFEISQLDYRENDHFVDLRGGGASRPRADWDDVRVEQKRVPFLLKSEPCAFCEGLLFCHGYLGRETSSFDACRAMLSEFIELHNLSQSRAPVPPPNGSAPRRDAQERSSQ